MIEHVVSDARIEAAIVRLVCRQPERDEQAEAERHERQQQSRREMLFGKEFRLTDHPGLVYHEFSASICQAYCRLKARGRQEAKGDAATRRRGDAGKGAIEPSVAASPRHSCLLPSCITRGDSKQKVI